MYKAGMGSGWEERLEQAVSLGSLYALSPLGLFPLDPKCVPSGTAGTVDWSVSAALHFFRRVKNVYLRAAGSWRLRIN